MTLKLVPTRNFDQQACLEFLASDTLDFEHLDWLSAQERLFDPLSFALLDGNSIKSILAFSADVPQVSWISFFSSLRDGNHPLYFNYLYTQSADYLKSSRVDSVFMLDLRPWMTLLAETHGFTRQDNVISLAYSPTDLPAPHLPPEIHIRAMELADLEAVLLVDRLCFPPQWQLSPRGLQKLLLNGGLHSVLLHQGQLIAYAMHSRYGAFAHLDRVAVLPAWQSQGFGKALISSQIQTLMQSGVVKFTVNTQGSNLPSQALYLHLGYTETGMPVPVLGHAIR